MKKTIAFLLKSIDVLLSLLLLYFCAAFVLSQITFKAKDTRPATIPIYLLTNGVHTDFVMPTRTAYYDWSKTIKLPARASEDPRFQFLGVGMGEKTFYIDTQNWRDLRFSTAAKAGLGFGNTAMHTTYYKTIYPGANCKRVLISVAQYQMLVRFILQSFTNDSAGFPVSLNASYHQNDAFYRGAKRYSIFYTCNTWIDQGLKTAGLKYCLWTPFEQPLLALYGN